jgi:hypothetical protein
MPRPQDDGVKVKPFTLSATDIKKYRKATENRVGRAALRDWPTIGQILKKASDGALEESLPHNPRRSRQNPVYKKIFSRVISVLPPIAHNEDTAKQYRAALLNIEDNNPAFGAWRDKHKPRMSNPLDLWKAFRDRNKPPKARVTEEHDITEHQKEIAQIQEASAAKIAELTNMLTDLRGAHTPMERAWIEFDECDAAATFETLVYELINHGLTLGLSIKTMEASIAAVLRVHHQEAGDDAA